MNTNSQIDIIRSEHSLLKTINTVIFRPLFFLAFISIIHFLYKIGGAYFKDMTLLSDFATLELYSYWVLFMLGLYWLSVKILNKSTNALIQSSWFSQHTSLRVLTPFFTSVIKIIFCLILANLLIQYAPVSQLTAYFFNKLSSILIIAALSWILLKLVDLISLFLLNHYDNVHNTRKIQTQILIIKRFLAGLILVFALGASLMLFDNVRALGASVLTTAGIFGLIITFAAQRSLGSVFAGLEIALTQPIKIGDLIMIDNESGTVEEINFRSVIVRLWDLRRLSVPTNYFLEKPFQNWSRNETNNLIGSITLYVDFTLPIAKLRAKVEEVLKASPLWDGKTCKVQVYDLREQVMQLRILASARNADDLSSLRCDIREKIITYIVENFPNALPITRSINTVPMNIECL